ncbi:hypothetical protein [Taibaiella koreensis]|uniref:hypothetical protein n=1 Tax=Taibaiella koreensis TaxID=1268548 RepID=UPI000E59AC45|nr:hypothetical protein [Taibaiella koreensis]
MKTKHVIVLLLSGLFFAGCSKKQADILPPEPVDSTVGDVPIPFDYDGLMGTKPNLPYPTYISPVTGVFIADRERRILRDSTSMVVIEDKMWNTATFRGTNGRIGTYAGDVQLNGVSLLYDPPHAFYMNTDPLLWHAAGSNTWSAAGNAPISAISQLVDTTFPQFTGTLPDTIPASSNFSFTFDNSNLRHANSAYLTVYDSNMRLVYTNIVGPSGGTVACNVGAPPLTNSWLWIGNRRYYGVWIQVVCYNYEIHQFGGRSFAFVRQSRLLKNVVVR